MHTPLQEALVIAVILLNGYCLGANAVERFVNYQTWHLVGAEGFRAYHQAQQPLIQTFVVAPVAVGFMLQTWLAFWVPLGIDRWIVWMMVAASFVGACSTVVFQLPIHSAFHRDGYSPELMRRLLSTDWIRKAADAVRIVATAMLLHELLSGR